MPGEAICVFAIVALSDHRCDDFLNTLRQSVRSLVVYPPAFLLRISSRWDSYVIESTAFSLFDNLQALLCEKGIRLFDIIDRMDIVHAVPMEELPMYLNEGYELYMKKYGIEDMRITTKRKT